ncbi:hypothetical protein [Streptomyces noursei]|uniref:hypothetical protein n=1 Tax=Streptomyces noursei TaxID=1971 RepID=UPI000C9B988A|nr:hypothetical protein [Streptomyces noursei]
MHASATREGPLRGKWRSVTRAAVALALVVPAALSMAACENSPQKALDRGDTCLKILDVALFDPRPKDAAVAEKDVADRADRLEELAKQTDDAKLRKAARDTAKELRGTTLKERTPGSVTEYLAGQNKRLKKLRGTCTSVGDYL